MFKVSTRNHCTCSDRSDLDILVRVFGLHVAARKRLGSLLSGQVVLAGKGNR